MLFAKIKHQKNKFFKYEKYLIKSKFSSSLKINNNNKNKGESHEK